MIQNGMRLQILSDLHIDLNKLTKNKLPQIIKPLCDNLAILGDSCNSANHNAMLTDLIKYTTSNFKNVYYVIGNHEYYESDIKKTENYFKNIQNNYSNFHLLNRNKIYIDGVKILGCTLWSNIPSKSQLICSTLLNDYCMIKYDKSKLTVKDTNSFFKRDLA
jgi:predicted MPP superfamily phosphohydrolase